MLKSSKKKNKKKAIPHKVAHKQGTLTLLRFVSAYCVLGLISSPLAILTERVRLAATSEMSALKHILMMPNRVAREIRIPKVGGVLQCCFLHPRWHGKMAGSVGGSNSSALPPILNVNDGGREKKNIRRYCCCFEAEK